MRDDHGKKPSSPHTSNEAKPAAAADDGGAPGLGFLQKIPAAYAAYAGLKELTDHADTAKEWAGWLSELQGAPE